MEEHLIEVHEELEKFYCTVCDLRFRTKKVFKAHGREFHDFVDVKGAEYLFCNLCNAQFTMQRNLQRHHETVHEKKRPFACSLCDKKFSLKQTLERHLFKMHEVKKEEKTEKIRYQCSECDFSCFKQSKFEQHIFMNHKDPIGSKELDDLECTTCDGRFETKDAFVTHMEQFHAIEIQNKRVPVVIANHFLAHSL